MGNIGLEDHLKQKLKILCGKASQSILKGKGSENKRLILIGNIETGHIDGKLPKRERQQKVTYCYLPKWESSELLSPPEKFSFCPEPPHITHHVLTASVDCLTDQLLLEHYDPCSHLLKF